MFHSKRYWLSGILLAIIQIATYAQEHTVITTERHFKDTTAINTFIDSAISLQDKNESAALAMFRNGLSGSIDQGHSNGASRCIGLIASAYFEKGNYRESFSFFQKTLTLCNKKQLKGAVPTIYNCMGNAFLRLGNYDSSLYFYYKSIAVAESVPGYDVSPLYTNMSTVLSSLGNYEKALYYLDEAEKIARAKRNEKLLALILINKGNIYSNQAKYEQSIRCLHETLDLTKSHHLLQWQQLALGNLGNVHYLQKQYKEAILYLQQALAVKTEAEPFYRNAVVTILGKVYYEMKNYSQAEIYLQEALATARQLNIPRDIKENNEILANLYTKTGNFKKGINHLYAYIRIKDSLEGIETRNNTNQLEIKYRSAQKDKEIVANQLRLNKQNAQLRQKNFLLISVSAGTLFIVAIGLLLFRVNRHKQRFQQVQLRNLEREQEINQLKAMMKGEEKERTRIAQELHDGIGGMLASLKMNVSVFKEEHPDLQAEPTLDRITNLLSGTVTEVRRAAHNLMPDVLVRQSLKEALLLYCENHNNEKLHIDLHYHVLETLSKASELFVYRTVQELVQNIVKHAHASYAAIQVMLHDNDLSIMIEDNGVGFDLSEPSKGIGLYSIQSRIKALQGYFSLNTTKEKGTTVHIQLAYSKLENL